MKKTTSLSLSFVLTLALFVPFARAQVGRPVVTSQPPPRSTPEIPQTRRTRPPQTRATPRPSPQPQQPDGTPAPQETANDEDDVVRITTNLVQMDVVIVDKKGNHVTDLRAEDFEVYEDKRPQQITNFSYVLNEAAPRLSATANSSSTAHRRRSTSRRSPTRSASNSAAHSTSAQVSRPVNTSSRSPSPTRSPKRSTARRRSGATSRS